VAKGLALTIGLNFVDPNHYSGWDGQLTACEFDAEDMTEIAKSKGFEVQSLLTKNATVENVTKGISKAAEKLVSGDIFMISYSGHGGKLPDQNSDEVDKTDETWCLYDRQFVDDELNNYFSEFKDGVRVLVLSDSCHSGTVTRVIATNKNIDMMNTNTDINGVRYRFAPINIIRKTYRLNKSQYDKILSNRKLKESEDNVKASVILLSGCQDNQYSQDGEFNGLFTSNLLDVWNNALFDKSYKRFHKAILGQMLPDQTPNYYLVGNTNKNFEKQIPFTI
jgi:metacaspase-1